ncbi:class I SAM-dependent methyltransferase [Paenibacillus elgii]|uniref:class I SAM-dependent methyltransferase n=1 Tax=Paenibacillus elgii TaxID=189691 RepID=UPI00398B71E7
MGGCRHEDALNLSFGDSSLDIIVSNDVYEHVPDINRALYEAHRVLRNGGQLVLSVPFYAFNFESIVRAKLINGVVKHTLKPHFHGNPVSVDGSLVFYDFGWNLLDLLKSVGFKQPKVITYYSQKHGYCGAGKQLLIICTK